ncbi:MAG: toll/interleukin-1 receptor domain-containing protein, partial [Cytophagales bacterium]|nr:toll/interleukin-1 receptor domain-containing protein [Cytophagales bacterium]
CENHDFALKLSNDLERIGISTWLDSKDLIPGQTWEIEIKKAINECSHFIILLSQHSVSKRGFVQKEQKMALNVAEELPPGEIFIIPARLEECETLYLEINKLHGVDLFPLWRDGFSKILESIFNNPKKYEKQRAVYNKTLNNYFYNNKITILSVFLILGCLIIILMGKNITWHESKIILILSILGFLIIFARFVQIVIDEISEVRSKKGMAYTSAPIIDNYNSKLHFPNDSEIQKYGVVNSALIRIATDEEIINYDPKVKRLVGTIRDMVRSGDLLLLTILHEAISIPIDTWLKSIPEMTKDELSDLSLWLDYQKKHFDDISPSLDENSAYADDISPYDFVDAIQDGISMHLDVDGGVA